MNRPNVLLIMSDQHLAEAMSCEGHAHVQTPHLDRLAASGLRFRRAYAQDAICGPSRCSMITGLYPRTLGILTNGDGPPSDPNASLPSEVGRGGEAMRHARPLAPVVRQTPLPNHLREHGYHAACFGKQHLHRDLGVVWDEAESVLPGETPMTYFDWVQERGYLHTFLRDWIADTGRALPGLGTAFNASSSLASQVSDLPSDQTMEAYVRDRTISYLRQAKSLGRPFFCKASFYRPHQPYTPTREYAQRIDPAALQLPASFHQPADQLPPGLAQARADRQRPVDVATAHDDLTIFRSFLRNYYALIHEVDDCVGDILRVLDEEGLAEDTIVLYVSDHGEFAGNHGLFEKFAFDHNIYESTVRVPFMLSWPGHIAPGQVSDDLIELVDIYPTILAAAGLPMPLCEPLSGVPLIDQNGARRPERRAFSVTENWVQTTVITDRWKYGRWNVPPATQGPRQMPMRDYRAFGDMVFDRTKDFHETSNVAATAEGRAVAARLSEMLAQWERATPNAAQAWNAADR
jgi:arylsulfatase A-like enzyme